MFFAKLNDFASITALSLLKLAGMLVSLNSGAAVPQISFCSCAAFTA